MWLSFEKSIKFFFPQTPTLPSPFVILRWGGSGNGYGIYPISHICIYTRMHIRIRICTIYTYSYLYRTCISTCINLYINLYINQQQEEGGFFFQKKSRAVIFFQGRGELIPRRVCCIFSPDSITKSTCKKEQIKIKWFHMTYCAV